MRSSRRKSRKLRKLRRTRSKRYRGGSVMSISLLDSINETIAKTEQELSNCGDNPGCTSYKTRLLMALRYGRDQHTRELGKPGDEAYVADHLPR
jgi:hypothetical protein